MFLLTLLSSTIAVAPPRPGPSLTRGVSIAQELFARAGVGSPAGEKISGLKADVLQILSPYGDPALSLPADVAARVDSLCTELEACSPTKKPATRDISSLDGRWAVRWSDAPPPSNGALGPLRGEAFQIVDTATSTYINELSLFGGGLTLSLAADYTPSSDTSLRVAFRTLQAGIFGAKRDLHEVLTLACRTNCHA
jgi:hypothetical protein